MLTQKSGSGKLINSVLRYCMEILLFVGCMVAPAWAGTLYVNANVAVSGNGTQWEMAKKTICEAITLAHAGDSIWVARGRYFESLNLPANVSLYGGFAGGENQLSQRDPAANPTIIDASRSGQDRPAYHAVVISNVVNTRLDGFTITGAYDDYFYAWLIQPSLYGGGIQCLGVDQSNTIANCLIEDNFAGGGGGMALVGSSPAVTNCTIRRNGIISMRSDYPAAPPNKGAGICCLNASPTFTNCKIIGCQANMGGGVYCDNTSSPRFVSCMISANQASYGGGVYCGGSSTTFDNCFISGNSAGTGGGLDFDGSSDTLRNCVISGNMITTNPVDDRYSVGSLFCSGGGTPSLINCLVSDNASGVFCCSTAQPTFTNTTFENNSGVALDEMKNDVSDNPAPVLRNCLFHNNPDGDYVYQGETLYYGAYYFNGLLPRISATISGDPMFLMDGPGAVSGSWTAPPAYDAATSRTTLTDANATFGSDSLAGRLVNPDTLRHFHALIVANTATALVVEGDLHTVLSGGETYKLIDYHLRNGSAALDHGTAVMAPASDMEGNPRPGSDGKVDIGPYEADESFAPAPEVIAPRSHVQPLAPLYISSVLSIPFQALDEESGVKYVRLFYRHNGGPWTQYHATFTAGPVTFDTAGTGGDGHYEFYTLATDNLDNVEPVKSRADAETSVITVFAGARVYVDKTAAGAQVGTNWTDAVHDIGSALNLCQVYGPREIWVAEGTYETSVTLFSGLALYGGFAGNENQLSERNGAAHPTIIDARYVNQGEPAEKVVVMDGLTHSRIDGFMILDGSPPTRHDRVISGWGIYCTGLDATNVIANCTITNPAYGWYYGYGLYLSNSSPLVTDCTIRGCGGRDAAGIVCGDQSSPSFVRCTVADNHCESFGAGASIGGPASPTFTSCTFSGNSCGVGGAGVRSRSATPSFADCTFINNTSGSGSGLNIEYGTSTLTRCRFINNCGGGMAVYSAQVTMNDCTMAWNSALGGGAIFADGATLNLNGCRINGNSATDVPSLIYYGGGGIYCGDKSTLNLLNCLMTGNTTRSSGGGIFVDHDGGTVSIVNSTIADNAADARGGGVFLMDATDTAPPFTNTIFEGNTGYAIYALGTVQPPVSIVPVLKNCLFYSNPAGDYYGTNLGSRTGDNLRELPAISGLVTESPRFVMGTGGTRGAASAGDSDGTVPLVHSEGSFSTRRRSVTRFCSRSPKNDTADSVSPGPPR